MGLDPTVVREAGAQWPQFAITLDQLTSYLAARPDAEPAHAADLYLACACLARDRLAITAFHDRFLSRIERYLGTLMRHPGVNADELRQELAIKLLIACEGTPARLTEYAGRGSLEGWVRIVATRLALDAVRRGPRDQPGRDAGAADRLAEAASGDMDGELLTLRDRFRSEFRAALDDGVKELAASHRTLLRLHYLEGMTTAALAALYKVSRNTIVRRIAEARITLMEMTLERFARRVAIPADHYRTLLSIVRSQMDVSVARLLEDPREPPGQPGS